MKNLKYLFIYASMLVVSATTFVACSEDDEQPAAPAVTPPAAVTTVQIDTENDVTFAVSAPGGYKSSSVTATGGTAVISEEPAAGAKTGNVVVTFMASGTAQAGSIVLVTTDNADKSTTATAVLNIVVSITPIITVDANITADTEWTNDKYYLLKGNIFVINNAKLSIQEGTKVFGDKLTKGALIVERGSQLLAEGTAEAPIVFTSNAPAGFRNYGDWGGIVLLGKASNNQSANQNIEGITAGDLGKYGGTTDDDNSGILAYVRIEFAGIALSTDNELNGLTMGSVGSGTEIHHIQVSYSGDDSFEWFGGTVNASYLIAYRGWDDDFDTDFGYRGNVQYAVSYRDADIADKSGSNGFESDNDGAGDDKTPLTAPKFSNVSWYGPGVFARLNGTAINKSNFNQNFQFGAHIRRNSAIQIYNSVFVGSYLEGVHFDKSNPAAAFKGNFLGRIGANVSGAYTKQTTGNCANCGGEYSTANFTTDNYFASGANGLSTVDLSTDFAGMIASNLSINTNPLPVSLLGGSSALLTGKAATVPSGLEQTAYIGAFNSTDNWAAASWTNYDPKNSSY
jgi:hypothetical protein